MSTPSLNQVPRSSPSRSPTPASASPRRSKRSFSKRFSRPTPAPAANTAARGLGWRSAESSPTCWVANCNCEAHPASAAPSLYICRWSTSAPRCLRAASRRARCPLRARARPRLEWPTPRPSRSPTIRADLHPGDSSLLIIEDDPHYARVLVDLAHDNGFKCWCRHGARMGWSSLAITDRLPSRWTYSCPTCWAGRC